ncbi:hypothetical protein H9Q10_02650 [Eikenella sp. S3360]|uniref:Uncharacterized protein n=1 Tax=Eikenella glucosivorans TaxID=2766967 RepID=A0ABS0N8G4_9NEIS|nr:hypothetical protein [Eikenella glucosivorans]MBH5328570.1 hypothetical protein [Eikenella glucosivorans]
MAGEKLPLRRMVGWYVLYSGMGCGLLYGALAVWWKGGWQAPQEMLLDLLSVGGLGVLLASAVHGLWLLALPSALTGWAAAVLRLQNNLRGRLLSALVWAGLTAASFGLLRLAGLDAPRLFNRLIAATLGAVLPWPYEMLIQLLAVPPWYMLLAVAAAGGWLSALLALPYEQEETWGDYTGERGEDW